METAKLSSRYQIVIPKKIRDILGLGKDDVVLFRVAEDGIHIEKFDEILKKHAGSVRLKKDFKTLRKEFNEAMADEAGM